MVSRGNSARCVSGFPGKPTTRRDNNRASGAGRFRGSFPGKLPDLGRDATTERTVLATGHFGPALWARPGPPADREPVPHGEPTDAPEGVDYPPGEGDQAGAKNRGFSA